VYAKRPEWLKKKKVLSPEVLKTKKKIKNLGLYTVCESASCPNISECFMRGTASFLILGNYCTRNCAFCDVKHGMPMEIDYEEGKKIALYMKEINIKYAVITSVTRDDLPDGGASHFVRVVKDIKSLLPSVKVELLVPDFKGDRDAVGTVMDMDICVFSHNLETVSRLYSEVRKGADYKRSLNVLKYAKKIAGNGIFIKSGIMVGLGETSEELDSTFSDLAGVGVDILTIGQYLRPSKENIPVSRYIKPVEFEIFKEKAENAGIPVVVAGPYIRSSYLAEEAYLKCI